ncbi:hypothetical protein F383_21488 [Gossypium arboreum]|uniref:Uncharacterized protein n=1 Tax=Gossypium arboreum TaxID=29729 RepID=A0A0B0NNU5_GOSAR|nr:protein MAINTENANCE OF MERISTEMS-like [Gossypium arboreum]XP_017640775.1 protein MAINTENANCE OF MERISTEMS-like [Gossypium arboreum]KHG16218.1 hypothetical protein F383_21488 [Gossypium arboreum]
MDGGHAYTLVNSAENLSPKHFSFHPAAKLRLQGTGFENLIKLSRPSSHFKSLIHAVADRYNREEKCFEFGRDQKIRLFLGLGDVLRITGLPIDGWPVTVNEKEVNVRDLCIQCFGTDKFLEPSKTAEKPKSGICLTWLKDNYGHLDENYVLKGQQLDQYVRATVLYIIGSVVLPSVAKTVSPIYLTFLKNVDKIGSYAWGAAMLASLHRCLQNVNKCTSNCLYGNFHFVTVRIEVIFIVSFC